MRCAGKRLVLASVLLAMGCVARSKYSPLSPPPGMIWNVAAGTYVPEMPLQPVGDTCSFMTTDPHLLTICRAGARGQCGTLPKNEQLSCEIMERAGAQAALDSDDRRLRYITSGAKERDDEIESLRRDVDDLKIKMET